MLPILLRTLAVVGVGALAWGCEELFRSNSDNNSRDVFTPPRPRVPISDCNQIARSLRLFRAIDPGRELSLFREQRILDKVNRHQAEINAGNFRPISSDQDLRSSLLLLSGFAFYVGSNGLVDRLSEVENLREVADLLDYAVNNQHATSVNFRSFLLYDYGDNASHPNVVTSANVEAFAEFSRCRRADPNGELNFKYSGWAQ
ncbi:MAG: hypothetical protein HQM15_08150 [Deltaproteobacteria bacterium]|nr:hypothetical protein [Deltaproteobacteria bacterium]